MHASPRVAIGQWLRNRSDRVIVDVRWMNRCFVPHDILIESLSPSTRRIGRNLEFRSRYGASSRRRKHDDAQDSISVDLCGRWCARVTLDRDSGKGRCQHTRHCIPCYCVRGCGWRIHRDTDDLIRRLSLVIDCITERRGRIWRVTMRLLNFGDEYGTMVANSPLPNTNEPCVGHGATRTAFTNGNHLGVTRLRPPFVGQSR